MLKLPDYILDIETTTDFATFRLGAITKVTPVGIAKTAFFVTDKGMRHALDSIPHGSTIGTWNGCRFDIPKIKELLGFDFKEWMNEKDISHLDGMLLAKILLPELPSFSMEKMAERLFFSPELQKMPLPEKYKDWDDYYNNAPLDELCDYLYQDLVVTRELIIYLVRIAKARPKVNWEHALKVEQEVAEIVQEQVEHGVHFDFSKAWFMNDTLESKSKVLERRLSRSLPMVDNPEYTKDQPPAKQFKKDGALTEAAKKYIAKHGYSVVKGTSGWLCERVDSKGTHLLSTLPLTSSLAMPRIRLQPHQLGPIKDALLVAGWEPTEWNTKKDKATGKMVRSSPQLTNRITKEPCPGLDKLKLPWVGDLIQWLQLRAKKSILLGNKGDTGWLIAAKPKKEDGKDFLVLPSDADTCGTPTARFRHKTVVNVPRVGSFMGEEFRSLFLPREGKVMVGWDANSLEAVMEAHYVYPFDKDYAEMLISGSSADGTDVHTRNWKDLGLKDRDEAKMFKYMLTYGAQPSRIASSLGVSLLRAEGYYTDFWKANKGLSALMDALTDEWEFFSKRHLVGLDGRLLSTRKPHAILNTKLQGGGAILMKHAMIIANARIKAAFPEEAHGLIRMHDEEQWEVSPEHADAVGKLGVQSIELAGKYLNLNVPITGTYKIGKNWAETH